jgi:NAD(P)-dependent dehydrogenase (short-subunit alcohol dehydrogenase family)
MSGVALITGGQQGIGLGIAVALAGAGFEVAIAAEVEDDAPAVAAALRTLGERARYFRHDVRDVAGAPALVERVEAALGPVTALVCNAGVAPRVRGDMLEVTPESFDFVNGVNLRGTFFLAQAVARRMLAGTGGGYRSIVFVTSASARLVTTERAEYCVSKAGAAMMAQLFAVRLAPHGIGVFDVRPGIVATAMTAVVREKYDSRIAGGLVPAARWGEPGDVGSAVLPLVEGRMVDGGLSIPRL